MYSRYVERVICLEFDFECLVMIGNTEEEIEEHSELTKDERRSSMNKAPKRKYEPTKHSSKSKPTPVNDQSNTKIDL